MAKREGWTGWDEYAPFYDWENARTLGRKDVPFWQGVASKAKGPVLELGCGTGRISLPLARAGVSVVGIDRSARMLERAARRLTALRRRQVGRRRRRLSLVRGDIRALPFADADFNMVLAPYGILQSLLRDQDLNATLASVARVLRPGGLFGLDLVPDVPNWREYSNKIQLRGKASAGTHLTLVESVRQDPETAPDHLPADLFRTARRRRDPTSVRSDLPHAAGSADDAPPGARRLQGGGGSRRLPGRTVGRAGRRLDHAGAALRLMRRVIRFSVPSR